MSKAIDQAEYERLLRLIENPPPASKLAAAREAGVDLRQLVENLRLTPAERLQKAFAEGERRWELREGLHRVARRDLERTLAKLREQLGWES
jgi:hypothetical protein